jgi:dethiobiotin synthetase
MSKVTPELFVTGTDTEIGKTLVAQGLVHGLVCRGLRVAGLKPIAAGCARTPAGLRNADALALMAVSNVDLPYETVNPYAFEPPIAPHVAAADAGVRIELRRIRDSFAAARRVADRIVVEGVGGWRVPIDVRHSVADMARDLGLDVILVVGIRLGCLNHALLTAEAIAADGLTLAGWVANHIDPAMLRSEATSRALEERLPAPLLGVIPYQPSWEPSRVADLLDLALLCGGDT